MTRPEESARVRAEFLAILAASAAAAILSRYLANRGIFPEDYVIPIYAVIVLVGGYFFIRSVTSLLDRIAEPTLGYTRTKGVKNFFEVVAAVVIVVFLFALFGVNLTGALIGAGFIGIVLGLAAQQVLGNTFAGLSMLVSRPFEIGDRVLIATSSYGLTGSTYAHESEVSGFTGVVQDVGVFFTRVTLDSGAHAVFPNSVVTGAMIVNYSRSGARNLRLRLDLDKRLDFDAVRSRLVDALDKSDTVEKGRSSVEIADMGEGTYQMVVSVWTTGPNEKAKTFVILETMKLSDELLPK